MRAAQYTLPSVKPGDEAPELVVYFFGHGSGGTAEANIERWIGQMEQPGGKDSKYDPYPAHHDVEVGTYYMHKGDVDAAIERFKDAIERLPSFAKPRLLLGEAYEKKGDKSEAVKYYKEYLQVLPNAPDAKQVRKKIEKLSEQK